MLRAAAIFCLALLVTPLAAHPVPRSNHDRTIVVRLQRDQDKLVVHVDYRLEVDPATVILEDMKPFQDEIDVIRFQNKLDYFKEFTRIYAPILGDRLYAKLDGKPLEFECTSRNQTLVDEKGEPLDHLRCDFVFRATLDLAKNKEHTLSFREANFQEQEGAINLLFANDAKLHVIDVTEPTTEIKNRQANERRPGDEAKLRSVTVRFSLEPPAAATAPATPIQSAPRPQEASPKSRGHDDSGLLRLFLSWKGGFALLMLACAGFGALHALTPGHGKTLVAAYLVGQRGTVWHALLLGLVTTITHTGAVLLLAVILLFVPDASREAIQAGIALGAGLIIVCMGAFLLLQRLAGRADHIHVGGTDHHHHGPGHHHHGHHHHHAPPPTDKVGVWGLIVLGITGGLIPCWDAVALLAFSIGSNDLPLAFPMILSFSAGLAGVLVLIGILVVKFRNFAGSHWGEGRIVRALPIVSALLVTVMGFWLCYEAVHGQ